jgi:predicted metal-dependent phosphotriesterase family hydrolase
VSATRVHSSSEREGQQAVPTLGGAIEPAALGRTLIAQRLLPGLDEQRFRRGEIEADELAGVANVLVDRMNAAGVRTLVDVTPMGYARSPELVQRLIGSAGLQIVGATGMDLATAPAAIRALPAVRLADLLIEELTTTLPGTGQPAGVLTVAPACGDAPLDERQILAAAFAHAETGAGVVALCDAEHAGDCAHALIGKGIDPENLLVSGFDGASSAFAAVDRAARHGVRLGFVACGGEPTDGLARAGLVAYAIQRYGAARVALSLASPSSWDADVSPQRFLELLRGYGISAEAIDSVLTDTPRAALVAA